jgi:phosphoglycerol transferase MdoB-like AlkP superfamily enzyme
MFEKIYYIVRPFIIFTLFALFILALSRSLLLLWQFERLAGAGDFIVILINGLRIDLSTIAYLIILPALAHPVMLTTRYAKPWLAILKIWFVACLTLLLFFELATPAFIEEYDLRPNRLFIEYLIYPKEVASMMLKGHLLAITLTSIGLISGAVIIYKIFNATVILKKQYSLSLSSQLVALIFLVIPLLIAARGTFSHRPINPSQVFFSTDPLLNTLTLNSAYSVAFAIKQLKNEKNAAKIYGEMNTDKVFSLVRKATELPENAFISKTLPTLAKREPYHQGKPKNVVIILEESLGAQFVGALGGLPLTPNLDKLINSGWSFDQAYATGTRSVRGIEAIITGFTPTPARAVVKLDKSQHNFFTLAKLLANNNYHTQFIYGGESHFDNMKSFFLGNGFQSIIDFDNIESPKYIASWGASDEDLFNQADKELLTLYQSGKPFFSLIFSSSNHDPFDIPSGKITPIHYTEQQKADYGSKELARHQAIQYADYALGKFITRAQQQPYYKDTIFLVVADHDARVYGDELVPIKNFRVPAVILNSGYTNKRDLRVVSQIDLPVTLMSLAGIEDPTPMIGFDLTKNYKQQRAMMQFSNNFAYLNNGKVAILQPKKAKAYYQYDFTKQKLKVTTIDESLGENALAHALFGSIAYDKHLYRLPTSKDLKGE